MGQPLSTIRTKYRLLRDTVSTADSDLTASTKTWAYFAANLRPENGGIGVKTDPMHNQVTIIFDFKNVDADTATFKIYAYREGGPAEIVCASTSNALVAGKQQTDDATTRFYADTTGTITDKWPATVSASDTGGGDGVAKITFDLRGYKYLLCLFTAISTGDNVRAKIAYH